VEARILPGKATAAVLLMLHDTGRHPGGFLGEKCSFDSFSMT